MKKTMVVLIILVLLAITGMIGYKMMIDKEPVNEERITDNQKKASDKKQIKLENTEGLYIVPTMRDALYADTVWCGTFQLVWNDMKNEVVKKDIVFDPQLEVADNLNLEEFNTNMISEEYYYKKYGLKTLELKAEIEKGISDKFNETSDILEDFDWTEDGLNDPNNPDMQRYFFYVMLRRSFEFLNEFDELEKGTFGNKYNDIEYFGVDEKSDKKLGEQIDVLYYNSENDFAVILNTKQGDEVIFVKAPKGDDFREIYDNMIEEGDNYKGNTGFFTTDEIKIPKIKLNEKKEYEELAGKPFATNDPLHPVAIIVKAIQTIQFELNAKGGEIKSEAAIDMVKATGMLEELPEPEPRYFYVDDTFAIFLREKGKDMPYFAGIITDITKFQ